MAQPGPNASVADKAVWETKKKDETDVKYLMLAVMNFNLSEQH